MGITGMSDREISLPNTYTVDGFYRMDAQISYPLSEHLDLTVNIQNLTNTQYYEPFLFLQDYNTPTNSDKKPKKSYSNLVTIYKNIGVLKWVEKERFTVLSLKAN